MQTDTVIAIKLEGSTDISQMLSQASDFLLRDDVKIMMFFVDDELRDVQNEKTQKYHAELMQQIINL